MNIKIEKAKLSYVKDIHSLIKVSAAENQMLPRALSEIYEFIRDFVVAVDDDSKKVIGCCALHVLWEDLAEIRSLTVCNSSRHTKTGTKLVEFCMAEAKSLDITRVFALTYVKDFFVKLGFNEISKEKLPQKVWSDCVKCHKFPDCDEIAVEKYIQIRD